MFVCGGHNIYPRQIETILEEHPSVQSVAVIGLKDELKGMKPYAFVVTLASVEELINFVSLKLPPSHWPRKIWRVETLPLNNVNKVDKKILIEMAQGLLKNDI